MGQKLGVSVFIQQAQGRRHGRNGENRELAAQRLAQIAQPATAQKVGRLQHAIGDGSRRKGGNLRGLNRDTRGVQERCGGRRGNAADSRGSNALRCNLGDRPEGRAAVAERLRSGGAADHAAQLMP